MEDFNLPDIIEKRTIIKILIFFLGFSIGMNIVFFLEIFNR